MSKHLITNKYAAVHSVEEIDADEDCFSDLGSSIADTDITSLSSSVRDYVYENGRRYHSLNAGTYVMPNDEKEQERLDMFHHVTSLILGGALHVAELPKEMYRVLDVGTGTGIWAVDFADMHPQATVIGVDLSPIQPSWVPSNCFFEVDDVEKPWMWKEPFDFIHSANIAQGIRDWPQYIKRIYDNLNPGGVVEFLESRLSWDSDDNTIPEGGNMVQYITALRQGAALAGFEVQIQQKLDKYLSDAGFVDIQVEIKKLPLCPWPRDPKKKELGRWGLTIVETGLRAYGLGLFTRFLGKSNEEAIAMCDAVVEEVRRRDIHSYNEQWFFYARKPKA